MKKALVTGGTRGAGLCLAKMLGLNGYQVSLTGTNLSIAQKTATALTGLQVNTQTKHTGYQLDLTNSDSIAELSSTLSTQTFDVIIHNAGMLSRDSLATVTDSRQLKMFMVNTIGPMALTKAVLPNMLKNKSGKILFFCPEYAIDAKTSLLTPYMQTKLAQTTFMKSLANMDTLKQSNISVSGFWTRYGLYTDALTHRKIGKKENYMDPTIVAKTVELMLNEPSEVINGKVFHDHEYLISKGVSLNQFKMGDNVVFLDKLFLDSL